MSIRLKTFEFIYQTGLFKEAIRIKANNIEDAVKIFKQQFTNIDFITVKRV